MKRMGVLLVERLLVQRDTNHFEPGATHDFEQVHVKASSRVFISQNTERAFAVYDVRAVQDHGIIRALPEQLQFEPLQIASERVVVLRLAKPDTEQREVAM